MHGTITEIVPDIYRISTFHPDFGIQFNQFLIKDAEPFLMHTGFKKMFATTQAAVASIIDPATLRWIGFSHFEPDECGALNEWLATAPRAQALSSFVGAMVMLNDYADRAPRVLADGDVLVTGQHRLRFLSTPQVPHGWDAGLYFDETTRTLLCSDLFFQPGDPEPLTETDLIGQIKEVILSGLTGPMAKDMPYTPYTDSTLRRLAALAPTTLATMHGSSFRGDGQKALLALAVVLKELLSEPAKGA